MSIIKQQLDRELNKPKKDNQIIIELTKIIDKGSITFSEWQNSGKFIPAENFREELPDANIHKDSTDIILYFGDIFVQVLKTDIFYVDPGYVSNDIKLAEQELWNKNVKNFF